MQPVSHQPVFRHVNGSRTAILMTHGIFGSPNQFSKMSVYFAQRGYTTESVLLPGHGGTADDFAAVRGYIWLGFVKAKVKALKAQYDKVVLVGHSLGGLLSVRTAAELGCDGLILIGTPTSISMSFLQDKYKKERFLGKIDWDDPETVAYMQAYSVDVPELPEALSWKKPLQDLFKLCKNITSFLPPINCPVLLVQSVRDETIGANSAKELALGLNHTIVEMLYLGDSTHSHFTTIERDLLFLKMDGFLKRFI